MDNQTVTTSGATSANLLVRQGELTGSNFPLGQDVVVIGREEGVDISLKDPEMSRRHARIAWQGGVYVLEDLGSTNGTYLRGNKLTAPQQLSSGDIIKMGQSVLEFEEVVTDAASQPAPVAPVAAPVADSAPVATTPEPPPAPAPTPTPVLTPTDVEGVAPEGKKKKSNCLLWGCGCLVVLVLALVLLVIVMAFVAPLILPSSQVQDWQRMLDDNNIPIQMHFIGNVVGFLM